MPGTEGTIALAANIKLVGFPRGSLGVARPRIKWTPQIWGKAKVDGAYFWPALAPLPTSTMAAATDFGPLYTLATRCSASRRRSA